MAGEIPVAFTDELAGAVAGVLLCAVVGARFRPVVGVLFGFTTELFEVPLVLVVGGPGDDAGAMAPAAFGVAAPLDQSAPPHPAATATATHSSTGEATARLTC